MADTVGDIIGRGWRTGRAIGEDFSSFRFERNAEKVRQKYMALAEQEGKPIEEYRPQIQNELDTLYTKSGARKRGVRGVGGGALSDEAMAQFDRRALEGSNVRAGQQALAGDIAGSRGTIARTNFGVGNYDAGIQNQQASQIIDASTAAIGKGPGGTYDAAGAAGAMSGIQARSGNMGEAIKADQSREGFRADAASALAGQLATMLKNQEQFGDRIVGTFEGLKEYVPLLQEFDIRPNPQNNGILSIFRGGQAVGELDDPDEVEQAIGMLNSFTKDPKTVLGQWEQTRIAEGLHQRERSERLTDDTNAAVRDLIKNAKLNEGAGVAAAMQNVFSAQQKATTAGWKFAAAREDGAIPATFGNRAFLILPPQEATPDGKPGYLSRVIDAVTQQPVNPAELGKQGDLLVDYSLKLGEMVSNRARSMNWEDLRSQIDLMNQVGGANPPSAPASSGMRSSGGNSRAERNNNPGNIEDRGQFKGMPGYLGSDGRFARFANAEAGQKAMENQLARYMEGKTTGTPLRSVADIIGTWSPQADPTNQAGSTGNYARYVASRLGVNPNTPLSPEQIPQLAAAMAEFESGNTSGSPVQAPGGARVAQTAPAQRPSSALPTPAPSRAAAAPAGQGINPQSLLQRRDQMLAAQEELRRWTDELDAFNAQNPPRAASMFSRTDPMAGQGGAPMDRTEQVRQQLIAARDQAEQKFRGLLGATRQGTAALNRQVAQRAVADEFAAIKARVAGRGGASDTAAMDPAGNPVLDSIIRQSFTR